MRSWKRVVLLAGMLLVGVAIAAQRGASMRGHMPSHLIPWIVAWGAAGYVVLCAVSFFSSRPPVGVIAALVLADAVLLLVQLASQDREAQFTTLNFLPFWHLLIAVFAAAHVLSSSPVSSPGPTVFAKPVWRVGLFVAFLGLLAQVTPKPAWLASLRPAISAVTFTLVGIGLGAFFIGGAMRLARSRASNNALQRTRYARR